MTRYKVGDKISLSGHLTFGIVSDVVGYQVSLSGHSTSCDYCVTRLVTRIYVSSHSIFSEQVSDHIYLSGLTFFSDQVGHKKKLSL